MTEERIQDIIALGTTVIYREKEILYLLDTEQIEEIARKIKELMDDPKNDTG